ncbi:MAG: hypothetical protein ABF290_17475 [Thiogranum sp.]
MTPEREINALLHALQKLYARITSLVLHKRMDSYREEADSVADHDLASLLSDHIDRLAAPRPENSGEQQHRVSEQKVQTVTQNSTPGRPHADHQVSIVGRTFSGLGRYLKSSRTETVLDPELSKKLKMSAWHHIHTALRLARQGEAETAKLHLDIASQALKEAAHYMSREEHIALIVEVEEKLGEISGQGMGSEI